MLTELCRLRLQDQILAIPQMPAEKRAQYVRHLHQTSVVGFSPLIGAVTLILTEKLKQICYRIWFVRLSHTTHAWPNSATYALCTAPTQIAHSQ